MSESTNFEALNYEVALGIREFRQEAIAVNAAVKTYNFSLNHYSSTFPCAGILIHAREAECETLRARFSLLLAKWLRTVRRFDEEQRNGVSLVATDEAMQTYYRLMKLQEQFNAYHLQEQQIAIPIIRTEN